MSNLIHIAETAVLMLVAYQLGWFLGFVLRRMLTRPVEQMADAKVPPDRLAAAKRETDPPIRTPVIEPVAAKPAPSFAPKVPLQEAPTEPLPDTFLAELQSALLEMPPAEPHIQTDDLEVTVAPEGDAALPSGEPGPDGAADAQPVRGEPSLTDVAIVVPASTLPAQDSAQVSSAAASASPVVEAATSQAEAEAAQPIAEPLVPVEPVEAVPTVDARPALKPATKPGEAWSGRPIPVPPGPEPVVDEVEASDEDAEAAAMRAIEGGWIRKTVVRQPVRDLPEGVEPGKRR